MKPHTTFTRSCLALGLIGLMSVPLTALAVPVTITVGGTTQFAVGTLAAGTPVSASVMYEATVPSTSSTTTSATWQNIPSFAYSMTIGVQTFNFPPLVPSATKLTIRNEAPFDEILFEFGSSAFGLLFGIPGGNVGEFAVSIVGSPTMLTDLSLPTAPDFNQITSTDIFAFTSRGTINLLLGSTSVQIDVGTNPIPEPSTMLLLGTGLAGIVAWRFKKQGANN